MSSSLGKLGISSMVSEGIDAYGELPFSSFLSLVCGQVYGYGWCGGWCFFSKTVISLLETISKQRLSNFTKLITLVGHRNTSV